MDSKHRHKLEQNALAKWLIAQYEDWIRPNSGWLGYALVGVLVAVVIIMATVRVNSWNRASAWKQYYAALHSEQAETDLELIANSTSGIVGIKARLALAQRQLAEGSTQVFIDKAQAITLTEKAADSFQKVQRGTKDSSLLQQAGFGLGQCWETLATARVGNDLTKAEEEYQKIVDHWGDDFMGQRAKQQLALIRRPATKSFVELAAAKTLESPAGADDFKVEFDKSDPFAPGQVDLGLFDQKTEPSEDQKTGTEPEPKSPEQEPSKSH